MYEELVKRLRDAAKMSNALAVLLPHSEGNAMAKLYNEAADAIEELMRYVQQMEKLRQEGWYLQKTKMMTYGQATMTMPIPEPPKEVE